MRRGAEQVHALPKALSQHGEAGVYVFGTVVDAGENVGVKVDHKDLFIIAVVVAVAAVAAAVLVLLAGALHRAVHHEAEDADTGVVQLLHAVGEQAAGAGVLADDDDHAVDVLRDGDRVHHRADGGQVDDDVVIGLGEGLQQGGHALGV